MYFPLSAVGEDSIVSLLENDGEIETRYAVATPKDRCIPYYFHIAIERAFPEFVRKFATTINIRFETLKEFRLLWHCDIAEQEKVVKAFKVLDRETKILEKQIEMEKTAKRIYLSHMFPKG